MKKRIIKKRVFSTLLAVLLIMTTNFSISAAVSEPDDFEELEDKILELEAEVDVIQQLIDNMVSEIEENPEYQSYSYYRSDWNYIYNKLSPKRVESRTMSNDLSTFYMAMGNSRDELLRANVLAVNPAVYALNQDGIMGYINLSLGVLQTVEGVYQMNADIIAENLYGVANSGWLNTVTSISDGLKDTRSVIKAIDNNDYLEHTDIIVDDFDDLIDQLFDIYPNS